MIGRGVWYTRQDWARQERLEALAAQQDGMNDSRKSLILGGLAVFVILILCSSL